jgi:hypothetical protein
MGVCGFLRTIRRGKMSDFNSFKRLLSLWKQLTGEDLFPVEKPEKPHVEGKK